MKGWVRVLRAREDIVALSLIALVVLLSRPPGGIVGLGVVAGATLACHAAGIVLVYRSNRIINFAQVPVAVFAALLFRLLVEQRTVLRGLGAVCRPCVGPEGGALDTVAYWLSAAIALAVAVGLGVAVHAFVVKRFADQPRLVATVATVGVAQLLASAASALPGLMATAEQKQLRQVPVGPAAPPPLDLELRWDPAVFRAPDLLLVLLAAAAIGGVLVWLGRSGAGVAVRAAASNPERAATLRIDVDASMRRVWAIAGGLAGIAGILGAMGAPAGEPAPVDVGLTVRILAVALIARMSSIEIAALAAVVVAVLDQAVLWNAGTVVAADAAVAGVVLGVLALQRPVGSRAEELAGSAWRAAREARPTPPGLAALAAVRRSKRTAAVSLAVVVMVLPFVLSPSQTTVATRIPVYAIVGLSLLILSGWAGQISLGQFAFAGVGAFVTSLAARGGAPVPLALAVAAVAGAGAAVVAGLPALRVRGLNLAITTLAGAMATTAILLNPEALGRHVTEGIDRGSFLGVDLDDHRAFFYFSLVVLLALTAAVAGLRRSRFARALIAARDNERSARAFGVDPVRLRLTAFAVSGAMAALAGGLFAFHQRGVKAVDFTPDVSILMFLMAVIGGLGSIAGPILGAVAIGLLDLFSASSLVVFLATGGGVVALLLLAPGGLAEFAFSLRDAALRRIARRQGLDVPSLMGGGGPDRAPIAAASGPVAVRYRLEESV